MSADYQKDGQIAVITLNNPPVNGLGLATRRAVVEGLNQANADASVNRQANTLQIFQANLTEGDS